jgi:hypothetical protein
LAALLEGGYDLGALALLGLALAALLLVKSLTQAVAGIFDFSLFGYRPLHGIAVSIENGAIAALDDAIKSVEKVAAGFLSGLIDAFGLLIAIPLLLGLGIKAALEYLWSSALKPVIHTITDTIRDTAGKALSKATALEATVAADLASAEKYARGQAAAALSDAEAYVETRISTALHTVSGEIGAAVSSAERYADQAVSKLRSAEDAAIGAVASVAAAGIAEAERLARAGVSEAEQLAAAGVTEAERLAQVGITDAIRQGEAATAALAQVVSGEIATLDQAIGGAAAEIPELAFEGIDFIRGKLESLDLTKLAGLIAAIPLIGALARSLSLKSWLWCANVGAVGRALCGIPGDLIDALLGDALAALALADLCELVHLMQVVAADFEPVLRELVVAADALIGCHGTSAAPDLELAGVGLPIPRAPLALA